MSDGMGDLAVMSQKSHVEPVEEIEQLLGEPED
jgi:hypothetical protein